MVSEKQTNTGGEMERKTYRRDREYHIGRRVARAPPRVSEESEEGEADAAEGALCET